MKTEINSNGVLTITPETELESYALECWWSHSPFTCSRCRKGLADPTVKVSAIHLNIKPDDQSGP